MTDIKREWDKKCAENRRLSRTNKKLRVALREVAYDGMPGCLNYEAGRKDCHCKKCIARRALAEIGGEDE